MNRAKGKNLIEQKVQNFSTNKADYMAQGFKKPVLVTDSLTPSLKLWTET